MATLFDPNLVSVEGKRVTFPTQMTLPEFCFFTGRTGPVVYEQYHFEYLPGTAPGGAEPETRRVTVKLPTQGRRFAKELRVAGITCSFLMLGLFLSGEATGSPLRLLVLTLLSAVDCWWMYTEFYALDRIECLKIEGKGEDERITLLLATKTAQALEKYLETCRAQSSITR